MASKQCKAGEWAKMGQVGHIEAEDEGVWARMVGGDWEGEGEEELKEQNPPPRPWPNHQPPNPKQAKLVGRKSSECILSRMTHIKWSPPALKKESPPPPLKHPPGPQRPPPAPKTNPMVPTTPLSAPRSGSRTHGAWRWVVCAVLATRRLALCGWNTQATPRSMRWPTASSSPPPKAAHEHLEGFRTGGKATTPPLPSLRVTPLTDSKTHPRSDPKTNLPIDPKAENTSNPYPTPHPTQQL